MKIQLRLFAVIASLLLFSSPPFAADLHPEAGSAGQEQLQPAKNIILLIGDGMSMEIIGLMRDYARIMEGKELYIERLMEEGSLTLVHAAPLDKLVIDSSAAATALATGQKTGNGIISMTPDGVALPTIIELAKKASKSTGLVTTTTLSHATPACFAAHALERNSEADIAGQLAESGVDVMMGGGLIYWIPKGGKVGEFARVTPGAGADAASAREDGANLLEKISASGYQIVYNRDDLPALKNAQKMLGLFAASHLPYALDRMPNDAAANVPSLAEMTQAALTLLSRNKNGFFLMVEGGRIDHAAHNQDVAAMIAEALDFDKAVGAAYEFARSNQQTALFITADHATAAPSLSARYVDSAGETLYPDEQTVNKIAGQDASFEYLFSLLKKEPTPRKLKTLVDQHTTVRISLAKAADILRAKPLTPFFVVKPRYRKYAYPMQALGRELGVEYSIAWATAEHFAEPVVFISSGAMEEKTRGYLEQSDIFGIMKAAGGL
jgi:alkaline phosphatase